MIIGRIQEQTMLSRAYDSHEAEFIVVYGRRRVGKTYLVREFFIKKKCRVFHATGLQKGGVKKQLKKFSDALSETFFDNTKLDLPKNWDEAFGVLHKQVLKSTDKVVIFLDELPWMATRKSNLLQEIDYYWNHHWSRMPQVILIVCGSSASWLIKKIIYNKGGLHNRVTLQLKLSPFNLSDSKAYLISRKIKLNEKHILSLYMALGGIPYYLKYVEPGLTAEQNIQKIIFDTNAPLKDEFKKLFDSLFKNAEAYLEIIKLVKNNSGIRRSELKALINLSATGGGLSKKLKELCETGFIEEYIPWNRNKGEYYKLIDEFSLFYLSWVGEQSNKKFTADHWINQSQRPAYYAWSGYAFEAVCAKHVEKIISTLKIKTSSAIGSWSYVPRKRVEDGAQIDLIIDRTDNAITVCEIKYTDQPFAIDKEYFGKLKRKISVFREKTGVKKQIFLVMIASNGLRQTIYSEEIVDGVVTLTDLFE